MLFGAVTRKKERVAPATVLSASSSVALRRSTVIGASRNAGSKIRLMLAMRAMVTKTSRLRRVAEDERRGHLARQPGGRVPGGRKVPRALDERLQLGLALARHGNLRAQLIAGGAELLVDVAIRRIQFGGELVLDERFVELTGGAETASAL